MSNIRITKQFTFETGHALYGYDGKCKNVHGHSYKLSVTVIGKPITDTSNVKFGMVIDFSDLKKIIKEEIEKDIIEDKKKEIVKKIADVAANSTSTEDTLDHLEDDTYLANLIKDVSNEESDDIKASVARQSRIVKVNQDFKEKTINEMTPRAKEIYAEKIKEGL